MSEVIKGLLKVVTDILNPEFKVSDIYNLSLIHIYKGFSENLTAKMNPSETLLEAN